MTNNKNVFFLNWCVLNKSITLPDSGSAVVTGINFLSILCGNSLRFTWAAFFKITITSCVFPMANSHLGDSGTTHHDARNKKPGNDTANWRSRQSRRNHAMPAMLM